MSDPSDSRPEAVALEAPEDEPRQRLLVEVLHVAGDWGPVEAIQRLADAVAREICRRLDLEAPLSRACVALSSDAAVAELNARYRAKPKPTNVLSFPAHADTACVEPGVRLLGDVVLARETVLAEAADVPIPLSHHLSHLLAHGLLHLLGFDHEREQEAEEMEALEVEILTTLGIADPYAGGEPDAAAPLRTSG